MDSELWFSRLGAQLWAAAVEDGRIVEIHPTFPEPDAVRRGAVYRAVVQRIAPGLGAAFVRLAEGGEGYLQAADLAGAGSPGERLSRLAAGDALLVQVRREAYAGKRPRVTARVELAGAYLAWRPEGAGVAVSRRITDRAERERLARWARQAGAGRYVLRSAARGAAEQALTEERAALARRFDSFRRLDAERVGPSLIEPAPGPLPRLVAGYAGRTLRRVVVETAADAEAAAAAAPDVPVERFDGPGSLAIDRGIWRTAQECRDPRVKLEGGASLVFERTEALWAVDVNAGAAFSVADHSSTTAAINTRAAAAVARQIRLRDVAGTILVDFLETHGEEQRESLMREFRDRMRADRRSHRVVGWTGLGLCELARRRQGPSLIERLGPRGKPTPWGLAAKVLADVASRRAPSDRGYRVRIDGSAAEVLQVSVDDADLRWVVEADDTLQRAYRVERL